MKLQHDELKPMSKSFTDSLSELGNLKVVTSDQLVNILHSYWPLVRLSNFQFMFVSAWTLIGTVQGISPYTYWVIIEVHYFYIVCRRILATNEYLYFVLWCLLFSLLDYFFDVHFLIIVSLLWGTSQSLKEQSIGYLTTLHLMLM